MAISTTERDIPYHSGHAKTTNQKMKIKYSPYLDDYKSEFLSLVHNLYSEDPEGEPMTD